MKTPVQRWIDELVANHEIEARTPNDLGGPVASFDWVGRAVLTLLLQHGMCPSSKVLDLGCGAARVGFWLIRLLDRGRYFGIEPDEGRLRIGIEKIIGPKLMEAKAPQFSKEETFDLTVFGEKFDYVFARSVWSHCSRAQIERTLDSLAQCLEPEGIALLSFYPAVTQDGYYMGTDWSWPPVRHLPSWIRGECRKRDLAMERLLPASHLDARLVLGSDQQWLKITRAGSSASRDRLVLAL